MAQLPEADRTKERLSEILEERELTFLYPLLRIQADLARQLATDPNPQAFYKWIKVSFQLSDNSNILPGFVFSRKISNLRILTIQDLLMPSWPF